MTQAFLAQLHQRPDLKLATAPEMNIICFRAEPEHLAATDWDDWNAQLQQHLLKEAQIFVSLPLFQGKRWLKLVLLNPFTSRKQMEQLFEAIDGFSGY